MSFSARLFCFPPELEAEYRAADAADSLRAVRAVAAVALLLYALFAVLGLQLYGNRDPRPLGIYLWHFIPGTALWLALTFTEGGRRRVHDLTAAALCLVVIAGQARFLLCAPERAAIFEPTASANLTFLITVGLRLPFVRAAWLSLGAGALWLAAHAYTGALGARLTGTPFYLLCANAIGLSAAYGLEAARRRGFLHARESRTERERSDKLLLNVLPAKIAERLKAGESPILDHCERCAVLFSDIVGYTRLAGSLPPERLLKLLEAVFVRFDSICDDLGLEKIKTIGDAYMAVSGLPCTCPTDDPPEAAAAEAALRMRAALDAIARESGTPVMIRIGIHSGPALAGVIGCRKFAYDLWGDTVNLASRLESHGLPGRIQISETVKTALDGRFRCVPRGPVEIKGKGERETYWLEPAARLDPITTTTDALA